MGTPSVPFGLTVNRPTAIHAETGSGTGTVALAGNPNVGKTSVFNALTGLRQYTGNWPGKTVERAQGICAVGDRSYVVVDLPGTYSLSPRSAEEEVARDFICFGQPDVTVVVVDATALERNLNLVLQIAEITPRLIVCLNLIDEARRKGISIDVAALSDELGIPVIPTVARVMRGIKELKDAIDRVARGEAVAHPKEIEYGADIEKEVRRILPDVARLVGDSLPARWVALRVLEGDPGTLDKIADHLGSDAVSRLAPKLLAV